MSAGGDERTPGDEHEDTGRLYRAGEGCGESGVRERGERACSDLEQGDPLPPAARSVGEDEHWDGELSHGRDEGRRQLHAPQEAERVDKVVQAEPLYRRHVRSPRQLRPVQCESARDEEAARKHLPADEKSRRPGARAAAQEELAEHEVAGHEHGGGDSCSEAAAEASITAQFHSQLRREALCSSTRPSFLKTSLK